MAAEMRPMLVVTYHNILVLYKLLHGYAFPINDRIILYKVNKSWHLNIHDMSCTRAILVVRRTISLLFQFPIDLLLKLHHTFKFIDKLLHINTHLLVDRSKYLNILPHHFPVPIPSPPVQKTIPSRLDIAGRLGKDEWRLDTGSSCQLVFQLFVSSTQGQGKYVSAEGEAHCEHLPGSAFAVVVVDVAHGLDGVLVESAADCLFVGKFESGFPTVLD